MKVYDWLFAEVPIVSNVNFEIVVEGLNGPNQYTNFVRLCFIFQILRASKF